MSDAAPEEVSIQDVKTKPPKKRVQTEKQKESFQKALTALKAKREAQKKAQEEEAEMLKAEKDEVKVQRKKAEYYEKAKLGRRKLPEAPQYVTTADFQKLRLELLEMNKPVKVVKEKEVEVPKIVEKPIVFEKVKVVEKPTTKIVSGNELLDRIFFSPK